MITVNMTFKIEPSQLTTFESWFRQHQEVLNLKVVPDTDDLYENDETFRKLVKGVRTAIKIKENYINDKNHK